MKIFGLFDNALCEYVRFQVIENEVLFRRWLTGFISGLQDEVKQNKLHPLADLIRYPNNFDFYDLGHIDIKSGDVYSADPKTVFCNLGSYVTEDALK